MLLTFLWTFFTFFFSSSHYALQRVQASKISASCFIEGSSIKRFRLKISASCFIEGSSIKKFKILVKNLSFALQRAQEQKNRISRFRLKISVHGTHINSAVRKLISWVHLIKHRGQLVRSSESIRQLLLMLSHSQSSCKNII